MADNIAVTPGIGATVATDDIGGVQFQRVKLTWGADGVANDASAANPIPVSVSGTIPVSGTFWQATQPISAASLPLPTGASTEASLAKLTIAQAATTSGQTGPLVQGSVTTAAPSYTTGQVAPLSLDPSGQLRITGTVTAGGLNQGSTTSGQQGNLTMGAVTTAAPSYTTAQTSPLSLTTAGALRIDASTLGGAAINLGAGAVGTGTLRITQASDSPLVAAVGAIADAAWTTGSGTQISLLKAIAGAAIDTTPSSVKIDQTTPGTTNAFSQTHVGSTAVATGNGVVSAGVQRVAIASDNTAFSVNAVQSGTWNIGTITTLPALVAGTALIGKVGLDQTTPGTTNAASIAYIGSTAVATGNGVVSAGVQRVAIASDNSPVPVTVQQPCDVISFTPTLDTSIYASGDVLFVATAITGVTRANDLRALLQSLTVCDKSDQKPAFTIYFAQTNVTTGTINVAPTISDADVANILGYVSVAAADWKDLGGADVVCYKALNLLLEAASGTTTVYAFGILDAGTPTFAASDLVFKFGVVQS